MARRTPQKHVIQGEAKMKIDRETTKKNGNDAVHRSEDTVKIEERKRLLARVAGNIAGSIISAPSESTATAAGIAEISVDVAEEILKKAGL